MINCFPLLGLGNHQKRVTKETNITRLDVRPESTTKSALISILQHLSDIFYTNPSPGPSMQQPADKNSQKIAVIRAEVQGDGIQILCRQGESGTI